MSLEEGIADGVGGGILEEMAATASVSLQEYLRTVYDPDREYVEGELVERNMGEKPHSKLQAFLIAYLLKRRRQWGIHVFPEQRVQVGPDQYRIPDICVVAGPEPDERIFTRPPFLWIEILSPEDRMLRLERKIEECLAFGVRYVWVIDPETLESRVYTSAGDFEPEGGVLRTENPEIAVPLTEIFED